MEEKNTGKEVEKGQRVKTTTVIKGQIIVQMKTITTHGEEMYLSV